MSIYFILNWIIFLTFLIVISIVSLILLLRLRLQSVTRGKKKTIAFFHPYCNAGGGGERVLWTGIEIIQKKFKDINIVIYTGDTDVDANQILSQTQKRFNITINGPVQMIFLKKRYWVEASRYKYFTLLGQSFGSMVLGWEALTSFVPDIYIDSMGYAFTFPLFKYIGGCKVYCYVHYPTISTDMLELVRSRSSNFNNNSTISNSTSLTIIKTIYYKLFAWLYGIVGRQSDYVMVNSTWTLNHINSIWKIPKKTGKVYPPCDTASLQTLPLNTKRTNTIVSIAQFRPEKNHRLQLEALDNFFRKYPEYQKSTKLILIGSCRNKEDEERVIKLRELSVQLKIKDNVEFIINSSFETMKNYLGTAKAGIHTMTNEHFGIGIVEYMASGVIPIAHKSAGPLMDIVVDYHGAHTGFLASDAEEYSNMIYKVLSLDENELKKMQTSAREAAINRFSATQFQQQFIDSIRL